MGPTHTIVASLALVSLAITACSDQPELVGPTDQGGETLTSSSVDPNAAARRRGVGDGVRLNQVGSTVITFSEFPVFTEITNQYQDVGILFGGATPFITHDSSNPTSPVLAGQPTFFGVITGTFVVPGSTTPATVGSFSLDAGYFDSVGSTELRWFDLSGALIGSQVNVGLGIETFTVTAPGIASWSIDIITTDVNGFAIDNVSFGDEPPSLSCPSVFRGDQVTCTISGTVQAVTEWRFQTTLPVSGPKTITGMTTTTTWEGIAVIPGTVEVDITLSGGASDMLTAQLQVGPRTGMEWEWGSTDWIYNAGAGAICSGQFGFGPIAIGFPLIIFARNIRASTVAMPCVDGFLEPPLDIPHSGFTDLEVPSGPNRTLWYVTSADFTLERGSRLNPEFSPGGVTWQLTSAGPCNNKTLGSGSPLQPTWLEYNTVCRNGANDFTAWKATLELHEGDGVVPGVSGHWGRLEDAAAVLGNDPEKALEGLVEVSEMELDELVRFQRIEIDLNLGPAADPGHTFVNGNGFCKDVWYFDLAQGKFVKDDVKVPGPAGPVCP